MPLHTHFAQILSEWALVGFATWLAGFLGLSAMIKRVITLNRRQNALLLAIGHYRLYRNCQRAIEAGYRTLSDTEDIEAMYIAYRDMGGNGTGEDLYKLFKTLPLKEKGDKV